MKSPLYSSLLLWLCSSAVGDTQLCRDVFPGKPRKSSASCPEVSFSPGQKPNSLIVKMVNNRGYPCGRESPSFESYVDAPGSPTYCFDDKSPPTPPGNFRKFIHVPCFEDDGADPQDLLQPVGQVPSLFLLYFPPGVTQVQLGLYKFVWQFEVPSTYSGPFPTEVFLVGEILHEGSGEVFPFKSVESVGLKYTTGVTSTCDTNPTINASTTPPGNTAAKYIAACANEPQYCEYVEGVTPPPKPKRTTTTTTTTKASTTKAPIKKPLDPSEGLTEMIDKRPVIEGGTPRSTLPPLKKLRLKPTDVYEGCASLRKKCIVPPKGSRPWECLRTKTCELVIAFQRQDVDIQSEDVVVVEMYHTDPGEWFAIGLNFNSDSPRMGNTYVIECVDEGDRGGPVIYNSFNFPGKNANKRYPEDGPEGARQIITKQESYRNGNEIYCRFTIRVRFERRVPKSAEVRQIDLHKRPVFVVAAWGMEHVAGTHGKLRKHQPRHQMRPKGKKAILGARYAPSRHQKVLMEGHGLLMTCAALFCLPLGTFAGRFLKETFPNVKLCRKLPLWLFVHVVLMTFAVILIACGIAVEIQGHVGWKSLRQSKFHSYVGGTMGGLLLLNFFSGAFVQVTRHGKSNWSGLFHALIGHAVVFCGFALLLLTDVVSFGNAPCHIKYIACAVIFSYIVTHIALSYHYCWVDFVVGLNKRRGYGVFPIGVLTESDVTQLLSLRRSRGESTRRDIGADDDVISAPGSKVRVGGFILLSALTFMYSMWASILIATNTNGPCIPLDQYEGDIS